MSEQQPRGQLEFRSKEHGTEVVDVSFPERTIDVVVMPYEQETLVDHRGRMVAEICARGAFSGIQRRPNRIKANRDHDDRRPVGKAVSLHPDREDGLLAKIKISRTDLGEETLTLADDGVLDVSAGFLPMPGGEKWETRARKRITKAWLGHIAFVTEPAYEGARVLAVRSQADPQQAEPIVTPNLDSLRLLELERRFAEIDVRYRVR